MPCKLTIETEYSEVLLALVKIIRQIAAMNMRAFSTLARRQSRLKIPKTELKGKKTL